MTGPDDDTILAKQAEYWVVRLASGDITANELAAFKAWLASDPGHRTAFDRERTLWKSLEGKQGAFASNTPARRRPGQRSWLRRAGPRRALAVVAAAVAVILLAPEALLRVEADQIVPPGEVRTVMLPDGSTAMLDSGAAIAVRFGTTERRVRLLRGRAWFNVTHGDGRPFRVAALDGVTEDVGTGFEVSRAADAVIVSVTQGEVRVTDPVERNGLAVRALERVRYESGGPVVRLDPARNAGIAAWRHGLIVIDGRPVSEAIAEIARYRPGYTLTLADTSATAKVSGVFRTSAPDEALRTLAQMANLHVVTLPGGIAVLRR